MDPEDSQRISRIHTQWSLIQQAHQDAGETDVQEARAAVVSRYIAPVYRYLTRVLNDASAAEDVAHDVVLKIMEGRLSAAAPERGRFRDYLRTVVINAARSWQSRDSRQPERLDGGPLSEPKTETPESFEDCVRETVMQQAWTRLQQSERQTRQPWASLLKWRTTVDRTSSDGLVEHLKQVTGREYSASNARKLLQRARRLYGDLLLQEVRGMLPPSQRDRQALEEELIDIGLHDACRSSLEAQ